MNDPHVSELKYRLITGDEVSYKSGLVVNWSTTEFDGDLNDGILTLRMKSHHSTIGSAQEAVRVLLRAWEIKVALDHGLGYLGFEFDSSEVIDRNPPPPGAPKVIEAGAATFLVMGETVEFRVTRGDYPSPPCGFAASPLVLTLWQRFRGFLEGKEPLTGMGYFCLSVLQADAGGRRGAGVKYAVHIDVLDTLGRLTSEVGDKSTARKLDAQSTCRPHTDPEQEWIKEAVKKLIIRAGEVAGSPGTAHPQIQMSQLPTI
jgi:hypothetical protein